VAGQVISIADEFLGELAYRGATTGQNLEFGDRSVRQPNGQVKQ